MEFNPNNINTMDIFSHFRAFGFAGMRQWVCLLADRGVTSGEWTGEGAALMLRRASKHLYDVFTSAESC